MDSLSAFILLPITEIKMSKINYFSEEGLTRLRAELKQLESVERIRITQQIAEARDKGDLSENAEYDAAKEAQGMLEARIAKMKTQLTNARVLDDSTLDNTKVLILCTVKIRNIKNKMEMQYTLVAESEADLKLKKISIDSPIGKGLLGKSVGDIAPIHTPAGIMEFEIVEISRS
jgi:transcription elongation factor GreA